MAPQCPFVRYTAITWSSSRTAARSRISGGRPPTRRAAAANSAPSKQCAVLFCITNRGDRHVSPSFSLLYGRSSRYCWIFSGSDSFRNRRSSSLFRPCIFNDVPDDRRNWDRLEFSRVNADDGDIAGSEPFAAFIFDNLKIVAYRLFSLDLWIQPHSNCSAMFDRLR